MKVSAYGDITISIVNEPFSVHLSNEAQQFPTDENRKVANNLSYYTDVNVIKGEVSNPNFTIGEIHSANGITVSKNANRITFSVKAGTILPSDSGSFDIPVTLNDETLVKTFSWSCQKDGTKAKSVKITADSTVFKSSDGETYSPDTILLTPILQGNISFSKWQYGAGSKWTDIKTGTHGFTLSSTSLILSKTSDLFTVETTSINIRCLSSDEKYYDVITIQKTRDGKDADTIGLDGRNRISFSSGEYQKGFFKNFNKVDKGYGEHTLTSKKQYSSLNLNDGFLLGCRDYKTGKKVTFSYDIMYTEWNFPTGTDRREFWIGQRYTNSTDSSAVGAWRGVTMHNLPVVGENGCKLGAWYHVSKTMLIPEQADESIGTASSIQFYNSNSEKEAKVTFRMKNVKLEYGEKETDWSPAPEDNISSIKILENIASKNTLDITTKVGKVDTFLVTNPDTGKEEQKTISEFMSSSTQNMYGFKREVKQQYNDLELGGVNLFVQNTAIEGKYLSSENVEINDVAWGYSDYINVSDMDYYIASGFTNLGNAPATCFYSADKVFLSGVKSELANSKESKRKMLQIPDGAVYMRFSFLLADAKTLKIEKGIKSTSYSPSPDDVAHNIKTVEEQTKDMFSWLVESGSSETSLKITNGLIEAITGKFVVRSPDKGSVVIENGAINAESITTDMLSANSITAEKIMADALKSKNYVTGESGSFLNLEDGSFDSKYLKWDNAGKVIANDITVVGGSINVNDKFIVNNDGIATLQGATVVGNITAESGKIGKFNLDNLALVTGDTDVTCAGLGGSSQAFWAGSLTMDNAPFRVGYDGKLYASDADISGIINSINGNIGGWKISSNGIKSFYSHTDTVDTGVSDFSNSLSLLSDTSSIILNCDSKSYSDSSRKNILTRGVNSLSLNEYLIQGSSKNTVYGEENEEQNYSFYLSAMNGLQMQDNISGDDTVYSWNGILFNDGSRLNSAKCHAGLVAHYWNSNGVSCGTKSGNYVNLTSFSDGLEGKLSELYYKKSNYQIAVSRNGVYSFQIRLGINSLTANKRVEVALFKNGSRYAAYSASYTTPIDYTLTQLNNYILYLSEGDTIDFRIAPIDGYSVNVNMADILIYALDYDFNGTELL